MHVNFQTMAHQRFGGLETLAPEELANAGFLTDYVERLFSSNGLKLGDSDLKIEDWLHAPDRAPYADMARLLWQKLAPTIDTDHVGLVLMAHWMPDVHLGTSVTNYLMHIAGIENGMGFSLSECQTAAPFVGLEWMSRYLSKNPEKTGLLLVCDQRNLMYRSPVHEHLDPVNIGCLVEMSASNGLHFDGICRAEKSESIQSLATRSCLEFSLDPAKTTVVGDPALIHKVDGFAAKLETCRQELCSAPFVAIANNLQQGADYLILDHGDDRMLACGLRTAESEAPYVY